MQNIARIYTLKETKAPEGYLLNETEYTIVVERESATKVKVSINRYPSGALVCFKV